MSKDISLDNLNENHLNIYNSLASEYEERANSLYNVTRDSINNLLKYKNKGSSLDIGCGAGVVSQVLDDLNFETSAIDISDKMIEIVNQFPILKLIQAII